MGNCVNVLNIDLNSGHHSKRHVTKTLLKATFDELKLFDVIERDVTRRNFLPRTCCRQLFDGDVTSDVTRGAVRQNNAEWLRPLKKTMS